VRLELNVPGRHAIANALAALAAASVWGIGRGGSAERVFFLCARHRCAGNCCDFRMEAALIQRQLQLESCGAASP